MAGRLPNLWPETHTRRSRSRSQSIQRKGPQPSPKYHILATLAKTNRFPAATLTLAFAKPPLRFTFTRSLPGPKWLTKGEVSNKHRVSAEASSRSCLGSIKQEPHLYSFPGPPPLTPTSPPPHPLTPEPRTPLQRVSFPGRGHGPRPSRVAQR